MSEEYHGLQHTAGPISEAELDEFLAGIFGGEASAVKTNYGERLWGAYHSGDLAYVFDNLDLVGLDWDTADYALADTVADYWVNLAATGNPNGPGLPPWPTYDPAADVVQILDAEVRPERHPSSENLKYLEDLYLRSRQEREGSL